MVMADELVAAVPEPAASWSGLLKELGFRPCSAGDWGLVLDALVLEPRESRLLH
jgi:hypothetical protein